MTRGSTLAALVVLGLAGCPGCPGEETLDPCAVVERDASSVVDWTRVVTGRRDGQRIVRLLPGAVAAGVELSVDDVTATADDRGAATLALSEGDDEVALGIGPGADAVFFSIRVRRGDGTCLVTGRAATGALPNDVALLGCEDTWAAVLSSGEASLDAYGAAGVSTAFAIPDEGPGPNPFSVAPLDDGRAVVTLYGTHEVALVDPCAGSVLDSDRARDDDGALLSVDLVFPMTADPPIDADGDGEPDETFASLALRHPQAVATWGSQVYVAFTNLVNASDATSGQRLGPGAVVRLAHNDDQLQVEAVRRTSFFNPQGLAATPEGVWVSSSGAFGSFADGYAPATDGGLELLASDFETGDPALRTIDLADFAPSTPALIDGHLVVGSLIRPDVIVLDDQAASLDDARRITLPGDALDSVFVITPLTGGLALAPVFSTDRVHVIDVDAAMLDPTPFRVGGYTLRAPTTTLAQGLLDVALSADGGHGAALLSLSAELVSLSPRAQWGP